MTAEASTSSKPRPLKNAPAGRHPERLGPYQIVEYLAAGGMADLYLARCEGKPGFQVVKRIAEHYSGIGRIVELFIDEGRIAEQLHHPNIVRIFEAGSEPGPSGDQYYLAMEYIRGRDIVAIARRAAEVRRPIPRDLAVALVVQVARGLCHAHEKLDEEGRPLRIVHCDISPGNIVVSWGGTAKIVDFGIARAEIQLRESNGSVAGKYNYMAPEQIRGEAVDGRADVFSLGVILYELSLARRLFRGRPEEVMHKVLEAPIVKPTEIDRDYDPELEAVVMRALERDPERRWPTARALHDALSKVLWKRGKRVEKRALAAYLREIFSSEKLQEAEDYTAPASDATVSTTADPGPSGGIHLVDDDEPNDLPLPPTAKATKPGREGPTTLDPPAPVQAAQPEERLASSLAVILVGFASIVVLYFLLLR